MNRTSEVLRVARKASKFTDRLAFTTFRRVLGRQELQLCRGQRLRSRRQLPLSVASDDLPRDVICVESCRNFTRFIPHNFTKIRNYQFS